MLRTKSRTPEELPGVYASLEELVRLKYQIAGFSLLPKQSVRSLLAGHHASRLRGRGLNFEELRAYLPGDDVGKMDWKATARTRRPHVRVFTEERDHPSVLVVDQRITMFFGSQESMKSVTAAKAAALSAWKVLAEGDRLGAIVFNDSECSVLRPQRNERRVLQTLETIVEMNHRLRVGVGTTSNAVMLNRAIEQAMRTTPHDGLIYIVSDFFGANADTRRLLLRAAEHNDVIAVVIYDPLEMQLPHTGKFTVSDGEFHLEFDAGSAKFGRLFAEDFRERLEQGRQLLKRLGAPVLPISTTEDVAQQLRTLLGYVPRTHRG